jgi:hypothetical protein
MPQFSPVKTGMGTGVSTLAADCSKIAAKTSAAKHNGLRFYT